MTNEEYWQERTTELESKWFNKCRNEIEKELADYYMSASQHIQDDIAVLYARFAEDNNLSFLSARKLIQGNEFSTWRMDIEGYLKQIDIALNKKTKKQLLKELNTLAMRSRINKLEKLHGETLLELTKLATLVEQDMTDFFKRCYADTYYRDLFAIGQKIGLNPKQARMDNERLEKVLAVPWSGRNYSSRIWENQSKLAQTIKETVMNGVHRGLSVPKMSAEVARCMEVGKSQAVRLVRTEMNYVQNQAILDSIRSSGLKYYRFCATLDRRTSTQCRAKDGNIFPVDEAKAGSNLPPLHPHCRSTVVASLKADSKARGWRVARNDDDSIVHIPANVTYKEWKDDLIKDTKPVHISAVDAMSNSYRPKLGNPTKVEINKNVSIPVNRVLNSRFDMLAEEGLTKRSKAIRLTEKMLTDIIDSGKFLEEKLPTACIIDFESNFGVIKTIGGYDNNLEILFLNSKYDTIEKIEKFLKEQPGQFCNTEYHSVIRHELGHKYYYDAIKILAKKRKISYNDAIKVLDDSIAEEISRLRKEEGFDLMQDMSKYAERGAKKHNFTEVIAEAHTSFEANIYSNKLLQIIKELIKDDVEP